MSEEQPVKYDPKFSDLSVGDVVEVFFNDDDNEDGTTVSLVEDPTAWYTDRATAVVLSIDRANKELHLELPERECDGHYEVVSE